MGVTVEDLSGYISEQGGAGSGSAPESHGRTVEER
jgi:hypothetical protein